MKNMNKTLKLILTAVLVLGLCAAAVLIYVKVTTPDYSGVPNPNVTITMDGHTYSGVMHTALDSAQKTWVTSISALDETGAALWATRAYSNYKK